MICTDKQRVSLYKTKIVFRYLPIYWQELIPPYFLARNEPILFGTKICVWKDSGLYNDKHSTLFPSFACNQAIEQTVNGDTKSTGGHHGISLNRGW